MKDFNYLVEKRRMLDSLGRRRGKCDGVTCSDCPLFSNGGPLFDCNVLEMEYPEIAIKIVKTWAENHPPKTRKDCLLETFPNAMVDGAGVPVVCAEDLGLCVCTNNTDCKNCWDKTEGGLCCEK